jgi:hypothetical protein
VFAVRRVIHAPSIHGLHEGRRMQEAVFEWPALWSGWQ